MADDLGAPTAAVERVATLRRQYGEPTYDARMLVTGSRSEQEIMEMDRAMEDHQIALDADG
jgi:hypothetical protein